MQLEVRDVGLSYGDKAVLRDVSFTLGAGQHALLKGPSGSGKSSLLNVISGLTSPDKGEATLGGHPMNDQIRGRYLGIVFQTLRLVSALDVRGNLLLAQKLQTGRQDASAVDVVLEQLGIAHYASARPFDLSQGETQRAAIARALVVKPTLLIADEPTSALDAENTDTVAQLLTDAAKEAGASLLVATHDERLMTHFSTVMTLRDGRL